MYEDDDFTDCELWAIEDDTSAYPHYCCGCGADGSSERPNCTCA